MGRAAVSSQILVSLAVGGRGTVLLCLPQDGSPVDPDPAATRERDVSLFATTTVNARDLEVALDALGRQPVAVAGSGAGGLIALALAAGRPELVSRLALIATPRPRPEEVSLAVAPADARPKTLLVYGGTELDAASAHGRWWQRNLPNARLEMTPDAQNLLPERWARVLSHLAPRTRGAR